MLHDQREGIGLMPRRFSHRSGRFDSAPRPFLAFAAVNRRQAYRLYRAQNLIWVWLGIAAILAAVTYFFRPALGPVVVTDSAVLDVTREVCFALGGALIIAGVWTIRRTFEVIGHVLFTTGSILNVVATLSLPASGATDLSEILLAGLAFTSAYRAFFIVRWIGAAPDARGD